MGQAITNKLCLDMATAIGIALGQFFSLPCSVHRSIHLCPEQYGIDEYQNPDDKFCRLYPSNHLPDASRLPKSLKGIEGAAVEITNVIRDGIGRSPVGSTRYITDPFECYSVKGNQRNIKIRIR